MAGIRFGDVAGSIDPDSQSLRKFIDAWFLPEDLIILDKTPQDGPKSFITIPAMELHTNAETALELKSHGGVKNSLYFCLNPAKQEIADWSTTRKEAGISELRGFFADLDVKEGGFTSQEEILFYLKTLAIQPTNIVESGSGGIHATWRASGTVSQEDYRAWWCYLQSKAPHGVQIDRLINMDRIFRLPGSVRWPKAGEKHTVLQLIGGTGEATDVEKFRELSQDPYKSKVKQERKTYTEYTVFLDRKFNKFNTKAAQGLVKDICEKRIDELDWADILTPAGWTSNRTNHDGTRQWIRPGSNQKSAVTDWVKPETGQPSNVMSLLSSSPDSKLLDLKEAGVALTKMVVLLRLKYQDNLDALLQDFYYKEIA